MMMIRLCLLFISIFFVTGYIHSNTRMINKSTKLNLFGNPDNDNKPAPKKDDKGGGMFGGMGNLMDSMKKAQEIAKQAEVVNKELMETQVTGSDPSGGVIATFNGLGVPVNLQVSANIASSGDADAISKACTQAMLDGHSKSQEQMMKRMQAMYGSAGLPSQ